MSRFALWQRFMLWRDLPALRRIPLFDADWYRMRYPDIGSYDPARHYLLYGAAEGRDPGPLFSTSGYGLQGAYQGNALLHYWQRGRSEGRAALPRFIGKPCGDGTRPVLLFCAHQALSAVFGAERSLIDMLVRARKAGFETELVLPQSLNPSYHADLLAHVRKIHLLPYGWRQARVAPARESVAALVDILRQSGAVALHQNTSVLDLPLAAARAAGIGSVTWLREMPAEDPDLCQRLGLPAQDLRACLMGEGDAFIANSAALADWFDPDQALRGQGRLRIVANAVEPALFELDFTPRKPLRVGLVGSLTAKKGIADFVEMAQAYHAIGGQAEFWLIGPSSPDLAALMPLPEGMVHHGSTARPHEAMAALDVVVSMSKFPESFGRTLLEAMAAGRPVLAYDRGAPPEVIGAAGLITPVDDPKAMAQALRALTQDPGRLSERSLLSRARAMEFHTADQSLDPRVFYPFPLA